VALTSPAAAATARDPAGLSHAARFSAHVPQLVLHASPMSPGLALHSPVRAYSAHRGFWSEQLAASASIFACRHKSSSIMAMAIPRARDTHAGRQFSAFS
jgi:hypothetical protein